MRFEQAKVELWQQEDYTLNAIYTQIERVARTCYKSENNITETSAEEFVNRLIKNRHFAMLEFGTVYLTIPTTTVNNKVIYNDQKYFRSPYARVYKQDYNYLKKAGFTKIPKPVSLVTTNYRFIIENKLEKDLDKYLTAPSPLHPKRLTFHFVIDNGIAREFTRHRRFSFAQESSRYCNYGLNKFNNELAFINYKSIPFLQSDKFKDFKLEDYNAIVNNVYKTIEEAYIKLIDNKVAPQFARQVLPLGGKTELTMSGFLKDWQLFLDLRYLGSTGNPHPYAREIAGEVYSQIKRYLKACRYYSKEDSFIAHIEEGKKEVKEGKELPKEQVKESN